MLPEIFFILFYFPFDKYIHIYLIYVYLRGFVFLPFNNIHKTKVSSLFSFFHSFCYTPRNKRHVIEFKIFSLYVKLYTILVVLFYLLFIYSFLLICLAPFKILTCGFKRIYFVVQFEIQFCSSHISIKKLYAALSSPLFNI